MGNTTSALYEVYYLYAISLVLCRLQVIADRLVEHFVAVGLMVREWERVKLHGTVMNTLFRKDHSGEAEVPEGTGDY